MGCSSRLGALGQVGDPGGGDVTSRPFVPTPPMRPHPVSRPQGEVALVAQHRLVHHGDRGGAVRHRPRLRHGATQLLRVRRPPNPCPRLRHGFHSMLPPCSAAAGPHPATCPTTTTSRRAPTSAPPTSTTSGAARATTTASSPRRGSLPAGPVSTTSPSPTPRGPRGWPPPPSQGVPWSWDGGGSCATPRERGAVGARQEGATRCLPRDVLHFELVFGEGQVVSAGCGVSPPSMGGRQGGGSCPILIQACWCSCECTRWGARSSWHSLGLHHRRDCFPRPPGWVKPVSWLSPPLPSPAPLSRPHIFGWHPVGVTLPPWVP